MPKMKPDRLDRRGGLGVGGPQQGDVEPGDNDTRQQQQGDELDTGGVGQGDLGQGGQRHPGGSSRDR